MEVNLFPLKSADLQKHYKDMGLKFWGKNACRFISVHVETARRVITTRLMLDHSPAEVDAGNQSSPCYLPQHPD